ncbi:MAG: 2-C-methyl-D-erythritol 4-phosphate cytidylyltransferase [Prevotellaceae bacterium]|jgi:2-C-methyl-D-erythritol 4-phosphate cytidylyltransferase|nr:2-C-methyl-D-erythritol 4-phosphate cytidylyltransferase [Prevotellaceae bacterium]
MSKDTKTVIIVAGGRGKRMGNRIPKQFLRLCDTPVLLLTMLRFYDYDNNIKIILTLPKDEITTWETIKSQLHNVPSHTIVEGGDERFFSVKNSLAYVEKGGIVAVHDGVRPFVSTETISRCFDRAQQCGAAIPVIAMTESIRYFEDEDKSVSVNRAKYKIVQTPQVFNSDILIHAYAQPYSQDFTDDASVVEKFGYPISPVEGNIENIKLTTPLDMEIAKIIGKRNLSLPLSP